MKYVMVLFSVFAACTPVTPEEQHSMGSDAYATYCAACHIPGATGPVLDARVLVYWQTAGNLFVYNKDQMPFGAAGMLTDAQYTDITAYMLKEEGLLSSDIVLTDHNMNRIRLSLPQ